MNDKNQMNNYSNVNQQQDLQMINNNQNSNSIDNPQKQDLNVSSQTNEYSQSQEQNIQYNQQPSLSEITSSNLNKKKTESDKDNSKWIFEKNFKKISASEFNNLSSVEKKEYENIKKSARKIGYVIEKKSLIRFYRVSLLDFIPLYIGQLITLIKFIIGYGDIVRSLNYDKKTVWGIRSNFVIGMIFSLVIWPIVLICVTIIYPYIVLDSSSVTYAWNHLIDQLNINGIQALGTGLQAYIQGAIVPLFHGNILIVTIIVFLILSMLNVDTFLFKGLLNINRKVVFKIQRESVRDEIEKIRVQKPVANKAV